MTTSPATATAPPSVPSFHNFLEKDGLRDETRELVSGLPRDNMGWILSNLYLYEGFWVFRRYIQGIVACQKHFKAQDTDIILASNPKCGTTWLKAMAFALVNRPVPGVDHPLLSTNPHDLVQFLEINLYRDGDDKNLSALASPRLFATHIPVGSLPRSTKDSSCKIVYVCRNPKDAFVSLWHFFNKLLPQVRGALRLEDAFRMFCEGVSPFGPFWDHVLGYWNASLESPHKVLFLKYEDMMKRPARHLVRLAEFLECPFSPEEEAKGMVDEILRLCSFDHMRNLEVNKTGINASFFRNGVVGDSENFLTPLMIEELDRITELKFRDSGLRF